MLDGRMKDSCRFVMPGEAWLENQKNRDGKVRDSWGENPCALFTIFLPCAIILEDTSQTDVWEIQLPLHMDFSIT